MELKKHQHSSCLCHSVIGSFCNIGFIMWGWGAMTSASVQESLCSEKILFVIMNLALLYNAC